MNGSETQKGMQKVAVATHIMAECLKRKCLLSAWGPNANRSAF
jgi:hypothetical protein